MFPFDFLPRGEDDTWSHVYGVTTEQVGCVHCLSWLDKRCSRIERYGVNGKALTADRLRRKLRDYPDPRFVRWHCNHCVKVRVRGFAIGKDLSER
jgi:hypothetical protein